MLHLISLNCRYTHSCLAQFCVRAVLQGRLPEMRLRFSQLTINDPYYPTLLRISGPEAQAVLFSVYVWNHAYISRLINDLARLRPALPVILGGPQAEAMENLPPNCTVFVGEIEGAGDDFFHDLQAGTLKPVYNAQPSRSFPSPYQPEDFTSYLQNRQVYYESSRGCPFSCSYCLSSISKGVRHKPLEVVKEELRRLIAAKPLIIKLIDRTFNDSPERALAIWRFLLEEADGVRFHFEIAPDRFTEAMFALLAQTPCGLFQFEIGIQSCNEQTLAAVRRRMDAAQAEANIRRLVALDTIHIHADLILGLPFETAASFFDSFNRVFRSRPHHIQLGLLKVLPGTEMRQRADEFGLIFCSEPPYEVLATRWLPHEELRELHEFCECVESFVNNRFYPSLWQHLRQCGEEPSAFFHSLLAICRQHDFFRLAHTQAFMSKLLAELARQRKDSTLLLDLLRYDWLRSGHRALPDELTEISQPELRDRLRRTLPQDMAGLFSSRTRTAFLKQSVFLELSAQAMAVLGLGKEADLLAVLPEQGSGVLPFNKTALLPL
ncbi:Radical SAM core domain-containing protein [Candidatus Electronema halotolerans]